MRGHAFRSVWMVPGLFLGVVSGAVAACDGGGGACEAGSYPEAPAGASSLVHVSAACPAEGADGSPERPFPTLAQAVDAAAAGSVVLVAGGTYAEGLAIDKDLQIIGPVSGTRGEEAGIIMQSPEPQAIVVSGGANVTFRGLHLVGSKAVGIWAYGGSVTLDESWIEGAAAGGDKGPGYGVLATNDGAIIMQNSAVTGAAAIGVLVSGGSASVTGSDVSENMGAGIRLDHASAEVTIEGTTVSGNVGFGIGVFSSRAIIMQSTVADTVADADGIADGILAAGIEGQSGEDLGPASVEILDSTLQGNGRVGLLCSGGARGIIMQNSTVSGNGGSATFGAGVWLQGGAGGEAGNTIAGNTIAGNAFVGIGLTGNTHAIIMQNNAVSGTLLQSTFAGAGEIEIGDGISLFKGASAAISGNTIEGNGRFGLILDGADGGQTAISANEITDNDQYGIIMQNQPLSPALSGNTFQGNQAGDTKTVGVGEPAFPVQSADFATE